MRVAFVKSEMLPSYCPLLLEELHFLLLRVLISIWYPDDQLFYYLPFLIVFLFTLFGLLFYYGLLICIPVWIMLLLGNHLALVLLEVVVYLKISLKKMQVDQQAFL